MAEERSIDIIDHLIFLLKKKYLLGVIFLTVFVLSYLAIYFFIDEQFEAKALIIPSEQDQIGGFSSILKNIPSMALNLGGLKKGSGTEIFTTIVYSRSNLEKIIKKFDLLTEYDLESMDKAVKALKKNIIAGEDENEAFEIIVRAKDRNKAAAMANFIVDELNTTLINLNVRKSRENREFLEKRYNELKINLKNSEDSLKLFQERSGIFEAENQTKATLEGLIKLESEYALKEMEYKVMEQVYGKNSPQILPSKLAVEEYRRKLNDIKKGKGDFTSFISVANIPKGTMQYFRYFRDVKIYNTILEFILPLYEQAKFEEQKNIPVLQVIDRAAPPEKRAYPQRLLMSLIISVMVIFLAIAFLTIDNILRNSTNPKLVSLRKEIGYKS